MSAEPIEFWFEFNSPYAYFASREIDALAQRHGRSVSWRGFFLGAAMKVTGATPPLQVPVRGPYTEHDWQRLAQWKQHPYRLPSPFFINPLPALRLYWWLHGRDAAQARQFAVDVFAARFVHNQDIGQLPVLAPLAAAHGIADAAALADGDQAKALGRQYTDEALSKGVFGAPFFIADGESFWGHDRLGMLDAWLARGGRW